MFINNLSLYKKKKDVTPLKKRHLAVKCNKMHYIYNIDDVEHIFIASLAIVI